MKKTVFLFSGEGTHSVESGFRLLKQSAPWPRVEEILSSKLGVNLEQLWHREVGRHRAPFSPLLTRPCESPTRCSYPNRPDPKSSVPYQGAQTRTQGAQDQVAQA